MPFYNAVLGTSSVGKVLKALEKTDSVAPIKLALFLFSIQRSFAVSRASIVESLTKSPGLKLGLSFKIWAWISCAVPVKVAFSPLGVCGPV
jgi:hypothetical protein